MKIREEALALHGQGCNCAQSVLMACGKYTGLDAETAKAISAGFGGGVRSGEICGAISGAVMALGLREQDRAMIARESKACVDAFREAFGCVRCVELKQNGVSCDTLIAFCAEYMEQWMENKE
ncbi:MAG: C_GCAxxG_C_C family protein [Oscillospiraceae bacterium]|nr:C_GCAxxG_C_C family protein [Oscillospiraceae bacterium]